MNIAKYDSSHTDFENPKYFPATDLLTYNQMINVLADPFTTLAVCTLTSQIFLSTYGSGELEPIQKIYLKEPEFSEDICVLETLEKASLITYFSVDGKHFGTSIMGWDMYREGVDDKRSEEADNLAKETGIFESNAHTRIKNIMMAFAQREIDDDVESAIKQEFRHHTHHTQAYSRNKLNEEEINGIESDS
jgi:hypothetical protein